MGFEALLGNDRLRENISRSLSRGHISHFYLISGPEGSGKHTLAQLLAAAIHCTGEQKPCLQCSACRKVMGSAHPDVITVDDPDHKTVPVRVVRQAREDMYIRPNESQHKVYLFPQEMGIEGQNALLKILEEPPAYGVFILLSNNPETLLPTVRSRCTELALRALPAPLLRDQLQKLFPQATSEDLEAAVVRSGGYLGQAKALLASDSVQCPHTEQFLQAFAARDALGLVRLLVGMERWKRDQMVSVLRNFSEALQSALICRSGMQALSPAIRHLSTQRSSTELLQAIEALQKAIVYTQSNVSVATVSGYLQWALR